MPGKVSINGIAVVLTAVLLGVSGCSLTAAATWPPRHWSPVDYGSFSPDVTTSYDGRYYAVQTLARPGDAAVDGIQVTIYESGTDAVVDSFLTQRAYDFWGVCWAPDSYDLWVQSGDVGTYCMRCADGTWVRDTEYRCDISYQDGVRHREVTHARRMPDGMIDRYRMRNGSFVYRDAFSYDGRYYADMSGMPDDTTQDWLDGVEICDASTDESLFFYPLDEDADYRGVCWARDGDDLWVRMGDDPFCLRRTGDGWQRDDSASLPDDIVLAYRWDGTIGR